MTAPMTPEARWLGRRHLEEAFLHAVINGACYDGISPGRWPIPIIDRFSVSSIASVETAAPWTR